MNAPRILVVRLGAMGDIIHALPAVATLRTSLAAARLTWLVEPRWTPLLEDNPFVDEIMHFERSGWRALLRSLGGLRRRRFDLAVDLQGLLKSSLACALASPGNVWGLERRRLREKVAAVFYSHQVETAAVHVIDQYLDVALAAGAGRAARHFPLPRGAPEGTLPSGPFVLASPRAGWRAKEWPAENYEKLALGLRAMGLEFVVNGAPADEAGLRAMANVHVHVSGLPGLINATRRARAVIGVDSGPMHLAAALRVPGVAIFGPTDPARNGPPGDSFTVLRDHRAVTSYKRRDEIDPSMRAICPEEVLEALKRRLAGHAGLSAGQAG